MTVDTIMKHDTEEGRERKRTVAAIGWHLLL